MATIDESEWLAELNSLSARGDEGFTSEELAQYAGHSRKWAQETVRKGIRAGKLILSGKRPIMASDGKASWAPVYNVVKKPEKPRK